MKQDLERLTIRELIMILAATEASIRQAVPASSQGDADGGVVSQPDLARRESQIIKELRRREKSLTPIG